MKSDAVTTLQAWVKTCGFLALIVTIAGVALATQQPPEGTQPSVDAPASPLRQCRYIDSTLVPQLVMGVRRLTDPNFNSLLARAEDAPDGPSVSEARLFRPYYVAKRRRSSTNDEWLLIQDSYSAAKPIGWVDARMTVPLRSRYAYTYADPSADLHDTSKDSYDRLLGQLHGGPKAAEDLVLIRRRNADADWVPRKIDDVVPFIELRLPEDAIEPEYPDTTPTRRFGIPLENRLVHMGAICGGPADQQLLDTLRQQNNQQAGLEMVFVVDETESMRPFFSAVADFVRTVSTTAARHGEMVRLAVSYYTDGPPGERVTASPLRPINNPSAAAELAVSVRGHADKLPPGDYSNAPERMLEGLRDSIRQAGFTPGSDAFVAIVGDTGHEPADPADKQQLVGEIAQLIKQHHIHLFFAHVGNRQSPAQMLFRDDFESIQLAATKLGIPHDRVVYQPVNASTLPEELAKAQERAANARRMRIEQLIRIESRTPYTEPGPKLLEQFEKLAIQKDKFDELHLQFYMPSRGWLFHPLTPDPPAVNQPQFHEVFFLAPPEQTAIRGMLLSLQSQLEERQMIDHDATVMAFAQSLSSAAGNPTIETQVMAAWNRIPEPQRSLGIFLEDTFGIRLKASLPFPRAALSIQPENEAEVAACRERITRFLTVLADGGSDTFWFDSSELIP